MVRIFRSITVLAVPFLMMSGTSPVHAQQLPGYGMLPQDGQIVGVIAQQCGGNPYCIAGAWATVEVQRCRNGIFVSGGCFGPNGEIMKVANRFLPHNLQPQVIINNARHDIQHGPGNTNDVTGRDGWLRQRLGF
jgi:hypothetical protein